ncbi:MAG: hypothetical protein ACYDCC_05895 [Actinomycetota bacterium]
MKRIALAFLLVMASCGPSLPDQDTINVCFSTIGLDRTNVGSALGWMAVAQAGSTVAKNSVVKKASQDILRVDNPFVLRQGFNARAKAAYIAAVNRMNDACKASGAFKGKATRTYG